MARFAPLADVLPRCRALVHHAGYGTTAAALLAGLATAVAASVRVIGHLVVGAVALAAAAALHGKQPVRRILVLAVVVLGTPAVLASVQRWCYAVVVAMTACSVASSSTWAVA